ncbi:MAG: hypothetical protein Tsb0018_01470 [Opitutales bacterium]|tara:strand:- start:1420 stop:1926 length:507 start_codon:yes stop_codon:yes gene_type:complete
MDALITYVFSNFSLVTLIIALLLGFLISVIDEKKLGAAGCYDAFLKYLFLIATGISGLYAFVLHGFFPEVSAEAIGWQPSPFQWEVAVANLGFGLVCLCAAWGSRAFRLAAIIGISCWLWGDAAGHVQQMIIAGNFAPGNAGSWFWTDVTVPAFLIVFYRLWCQSRAN